jgi:hypothetical protein
MENQYRGGLNMNTRMLFITLVFLTTITVVIAGGSKKKLSMEEANDILAGTWMNEEYNEVGRAYKFIVQRDGTYTGFPIDLEPEDQLRYMYRIYYRQ